MICKNYFWEVGGTVYSLCTYLLNKRFAGIVELVL